MEKNKRRRTKWPYKLKSKKSTTPIQAKKTTKNDRWRASGGSRFRRRSPRPKGCKANQEPNKKACFGHWEHIEILMIFKFSMIQTRISSRALFLLTVEIYSWINRFMTSFMALHEASNRFATSLCLWPRQPVPTRATWRCQDLNVTDCSFLLRRESVNLWISVDICFSRLVDVT